MKMMFLRQGTRSIEDYVVDFLELAHLTQLDDLCLIIFFRGGLSEPLSSIMLLHDPNWMLEKYIDIALQLSGSPFTVGIVEKENNAPVITSTPEPCHKMAAASEFRPIMTAVRTGQKTGIVCGSALVNCVTDCSVHPRFLIGECPYS